MDEGELAARKQVRDGQYPRGYAPPTALSDDPDKVAMADNNAKPPGPPLLGGVHHYNSIHYGAMRAYSDIFVIDFGESEYVPAPAGWETYSGIEVDPHYLWVFRPTGFACATHASVISCRQGKRPAPRWMVYSLNFGPNEILGENSIGGASGVGKNWDVNGQLTKAKPPVKGLISLFPCIDETLTASVYRRTVTRCDRPRPLDQTRWQCDAGPKNADTLLVSVREPEGSIAGQRQTHGARGKVG